LCLCYFSFFHSAIFLLGGSSIPHLNTVESPLGYVFWRIICDNLYFQNCINLVPLIVFSFKANAFFKFGDRFSWNGTNVSHWRFHDNPHMNTSADVLKFQTLPVHVKCWILLKPVLVDVDGNLHIPLASMNRFYQTEPATFSIFSVFFFVLKGLFRITYSRYCIMCIICCINKNLEHSSWKSG
jgi:hypothetical protein